MDKFSLFGKMKTITTFNNVDKSNNRYLLNVPLTKGLEFLDIKEFQQL